MPLNGRTLHASKLCKCERRCVFYPANAAAVSQLILTGKRRVSNLPLLVYRSIAGHACPAGTFAMDCLTMPHDISHPVCWSRRNWILFSVATLVGCTSPIVRTQSPESEEYAELEDQIRLVGDFTAIWGLNDQTVESVALVTNLKNSGSDPPVSSQRNILIDEMKSQEVSKPQAILALETTSMVIVRAKLPPAVQKGDRLDMEVLTPRRSKTTSLRGGWLMPTRLKQHEVLGGSIQTSHPLAVAKGDVIVDAVFDKSDDPDLELRGKILGGCVATKNRMIGLAIREGSSSIRTSTEISAAINRRFFYYDHGIKRGVANPITDSRIDLQLQVGYKNNIYRYLHVMRQIPLRESESQLATRLEMLEANLMQPAFARDTAIKLEAIGEPAHETLRKGLTSNDAEVRFYAAEALAYLDDPDAATELGKSAQEPAFRYNALTALTAMNHVAAYDALSNLLHHESAETRYGAFRALQRRNPNDPLVGGDRIGESIHLHTIASSGSEMVHFSTNRSQEIVLFGHDIRLHAPFVFNAGQAIMVKADTTGQVMVKRFASGTDEDRQIDCSDRLGDILRAAVELGATYADLYAFIQEANGLGDDSALTAKLAVEAVATPNREYQREDDSENDFVIEPEEKPRSMLSRLLYNPWSGVEE